MDDKQKQLAEGLLHAIKGERDGYSFYMMAANSTEDTQGKEIFERLAREEHDHMLFLKKQYDALVKNGKIDDSLTLGRPGQLSETSPIFSENFKTRLRDGHYEMTALSISIRLELDSMTYYRQQAKAAAEPGVKKFYTELADWENGHYQALLRQQDELKDDYWAAGGFAPF